MNNYNKYLVSFFDNLRNSTPICTIHVLEVFEQIQEGKWSKQIEACKNDLNKKKELPCFTPSGIFLKRNKQGIENYSGLICLDIDKVNDPERLKEQCKTIPWIWSTFITPSGSGLKIFVQTPSELSQFQIYEAEVARAFYTITGYLRDEKSKDLARLQFVSYDEKIYINENPILFKI